MELHNAPDVPLIPHAAHGGSRVAPLFLLGLTITLETIGTLLLKQLDALSRAVAFLCYFTSLGLFSYVVQVVPLSVAYATWCTAGSAGVTVLSSVVYGDVLRPAQYVCIAASIPCVVGLHIL